MRRALVVLAAGLALVLAAQPAGAKSDTKRTLAEIGAALEARGITACDSPDWTKKQDEADEPIGKGVSAFRVRLVMGPGRPCPDRAAYADEVDWEHAHDAYLLVTVYKSKSSKAYKKQAAPKPGVGSYIFAYKRALILRPLADVLQQPFLAAMGDLGARPTS